MKRRVKWFKQRQSGRVYKHAWIGYSYRNENGTPDFKREVSLQGMPEEVIRDIESALRNDEPLSSVDSGLIEFVDSFEVGAAWVALRLAQQLGIFEELDRFGPEVRLALQAMILDRVVTAIPHSKLGLWETLPGSALWHLLGPDREPPELHCFYTGLKQIHAAQDSIQKSLFAKNRKAKQMYLYDITSSYLEGQKCPIGQFGYNRDGKKGKLQIVIGLLTDLEGFPIAVRVFEGNTSDQTTVLGQIDALKNEFGVEELVFVGDRGMLTQARRRDLDQEEYAKVRYISALTRREFFQFLDDQNHPLQLSIFDRSNLVEVACDGTRYVLSFNPHKEQDDRRTRLRLLEKTEEKLQMIKRNVDAGRLKKADAIAKKMYLWLNRWSMSKFFTCNYKDGLFTYERDEERIKQFEAIDGFYVIVSDTDAQSLNTGEVRSSYKSLILVEQAFRSMKTTDLFVRPIRHWNPEHVKGHVFVCMLSYMIVWEARKRLGEFISHDPLDPMDEELDPNESCHSLRTVWEKLNQSVKIVKLKIAGKLQVQVKPITAKVKKMLKAAGASLDAQAKTLLRIVG